MSFPIVDIITGLAKPIVDLVDVLHTSEEEKLTIKQKMFELQVVLYNKILEYEGKLVDAQSKVIEAEATSESWLAANWRPLTMVVFVSLVVNRWTGLTVLFGIPQVMIPHDVEMELWSVIKIGLGGYVAGRSLEKIAPSIADAIGNFKK